MELKPMMTVSEIKFLKEIVHSLLPESVIFEIGTAEGGSAAVMASVNPKVKIYTIDLFSINGTDTDSITETYNTVRNNLSEFSNVEVLCGNAMTDFIDWKTEIDLYFEDGSHFEPALSRNLDRWIQFIKSNGFLLLHDNNSFCPDVEKNVNRLIKSGMFEIIKSVDSLVLLKRKEK